MNRMRKILETFGILAGIIFISVGVNQFFFEFILMFELGNYLPWYRRIDLGAALWLLLIIIGGMLVFGCVRDLLHQKWNRHLEAVVTGRDWITVEELTAEMQCGQDKMLRRLKRQLRKGKFPGASLDVQEGLLIMDDSIRAEYENAWKEWTEKQSECGRAGISLAVQEEFLEGRRQAYALEEQALVLKNNKMRDKLLYIAKICEDHFASVENETDNLQQLEQIRTDYLPQVERMAKRYAEMEVLQTPEEMEAMSGEFMGFLDKFPLVGK